VLFLKALNSVIRIPPTHPTMQPSTQVMVAHVDTTPGNSSSLPSLRTHAPQWALYRSSPPDSHGYQHQACGIVILWRKTRVRTPPSFPPPRLDGKRGARFIHWRSMHIMGLLSRHEQARRRRKHFLPTALLCQSFFREP
jgi:hypothetical protein